MTLCAGKKKMNNYWEDKNMSEELKVAHNKMVEEMGIPEWAIVDCPFCKKKLNPRAIRSISLCFNARNIGDIAVEFCCDECSKMDTMYFRNAAQTIRDFVGELSEEFDSIMIPILEEKMYSLKYNNLVEKMHIHKEK